MIQKASNLLPFTKCSVTTSAKSLQLLLGLLKKNKVLQVARSSEGISSTQRKFQSKPTEPAYATDHHI